MNPFIVIGGILVLILLYVWSLYNGLISLKTQIEEAWSQIDVQLKRRSDLIPNLISTVKGYAKHEKSIMDSVTRARASMLSAKSMNAKAKASEDLSGVLGKLLAIAENYPQLKANDSFIQLQKELSDTEDKVAYARQYYNNSVMEFNTKIRTFPNTLVNERLGFPEKEFFGATEEERKTVKVNFE
jgi:LemA protein